MSRWQNRVQNAVVFVRGRGNGLKIKRSEELAYWKGVSQREAGEMTNDHYQWFYTTNFGRTLEDYNGCRILDIGCGPRGSLEWATMAAERVGLDPLADQYRALGTDRHGMTYVTAGSETIPFPDGHFDIVTSFNSLDHVDDLDLTIKEIGRVTASGGLFLLITDVNHDPTFTEPLSFSWDIVDRFTEFDVAEARHLEKKRIDNMYASVKDAVPYDHTDPGRRYGILSAKLRRR